MPFVNDGEGTACQPGSQFHRNPIVVFAIGVAGPRGKSETCDSHFRSRSIPRHENRTEVTSPPTIRGNPKKLDGGKIGSGPCQHTPRTIFMSPGLNENTDPFPIRQLPNNLSIDPINGGQFPGPIRGVMRPPQPGRLMRLPFRRHAKP